MARKNLTIVGVLLLAGCTFQGIHQEPLIPAPSLLPSVTREMKTAGFWIAQHPSPDQLILNSSDIEKFNRHVQDDLKLTKDITLWEKGYPGADLRAALQKSWEDFVIQSYYQANGRRALPEFYEHVWRNFQVDRVPETIDVRYGFIVRYADQRFFPTGEGLFAKPFDLDFDELQNSDLDIGTPVAILHQSADREWLYVETDLSGGWVKANQVALGTLEDVRNFFRQEPFAVMIKAKTDMYLDVDMTDHHDHVRMGVRFPIEGKPVGERIVVRLPTRGQDGELVWKNAYVQREDVSVGYLSYTPRTIIEQAFQLHNAPYGWGGMYGEQDCSRFLQEVFSTVGIRLPRNSSEQAKVGDQLVRFDKSSSEENKLSALRQALPGASILTMKGHIMLHLGEFEGRPFAIHATWGYREPQGAGQVVRVINRVVVSDLSLGEGSKKGSLLQRLISIVEIK